MESRRADKVRKTLAVQARIFTHSGAAGAPSVHSLGDGAAAAAERSSHAAVGEQRDGGVHRGDRSYSKAVAGLGERFGGETLLRGPVLEMLEGEKDLGERILVSRFPDAAAARAYVASPEYQTAKQLRAGAARVAIRLVEG